MDVLGGMSNKSGCLRNECAKKKLRRRSVKESGCLRRVCVNGNEYIRLVCVQGLSKEVCGIVKGNECPRWGLCKEK